MASPFKWIADESETWYIEQQNDSDLWLEYVDHAISANFTQTAFDTDSDGYPVIVLADQNRSKVLKLTQGICLIGHKLSGIIENEYTTGFWLSKLGNSF